LKYHYLPPSKLKALGKLTPLQTTGDITNSFQFKNVSLLISNPKSSISSSKGKKTIRKLDGQARPSLGKVLRIFLLRSISGLA